MLIHRLDECPDRVWSRGGPRRPFIEGTQDLLRSIIIPRLSLRLAAGSASLQQLARAEEFIEGRFSEELSIDDIAEAAGVSVRALQIAFRRHRDCSPKQFLMLLRLKRVRERLRAGDAITITRIAQEAGFTHAGRFSAAYRTEFGELPSQTHRRAYQSRS
jgi:transcriptional regulator GlxA family with amidase domain